MKTSKCLKPVLPIAFFSEISGAAVAAGGGGVPEDPGPIQGRQFDS